MLSNSSRVVLSTLASGSSGNATLITQGNTNILVDCGVSGARLQQNMNLISKEPSELSAIFITHEHIDHIRAAGVMSRRFGLPVYASIGTWAAMENQIGAIKEENKRYVQAGQELCIGQTAVCPFSVSHDAKEPLGYVFGTGANSAAVATDMGTMSKEVFDAIKNCGTVLLESNHDLKMLINGPYPEHLKRRIRSDVGHLSNTFSASVCVRLARMGVKKILLGHLSEKNNMPHLAYTTAKSALVSDGAQPDEITLKVAERYLPTVI